MTHPFIERINKYRKCLEDKAVMILDVETTLINKNKYKTIFNDPPKFVMSGELFIREELIKDNITIINTNHIYASIFKLSPIIYVGHNVTYDLFIGYNESRDPFYFTELIWDTMFAEYLLSDQQERMIGLEDLCSRYKIPVVKTPEVAEAMKNGVCPSTMDRDKLEEYLKNDIYMTALVFQKQHELFKARSVSWQNMFINQMIFLQNTLRASINGMKINRQFVETNKENLQEQIDDLEKEMLDFVESEHPDIPRTEWNLSSNKDLSIFLYGGAKKWTEKVQTGVYKTGLKVGKPKYSNKENAKAIDGMFPGNGSVDEEALKSILNKYSKSTIFTNYHNFIMNLLKYRDLKKNLNTYFEGYMNYATEDDYINPKFNHGLTPTGRLTCSSPNLQNIKG